MDGHRLRAPAEDGGLLSEPPLSAALKSLDQNRAALADWEHDFQGRSAQALRIMARRQVLEQSRRYHERFGLDTPPGAGDPAAPWILTGHQAELFHPGVWSKNFAASALARSAGGLGLNLVVDNDVPRSPGIRVPVITDEGLLHAVTVEFDSWRAEAPYEDWPVRDEARFATFPDRVRDALAGSVADPVLDEFWPRVLAASTVTDRSGYRFAAARRGVEAAWGAHNAEVPLSAVCETEAFHWFACHIIAHARRFQEVHNAALKDYRDRYGIRSTHHPVPALTARDGWHEAPFWVWRANAPRRRPLLAQAAGRTIRLRASGEDAPFLELPLAADREACCAVERLRELPSQGIRLRTRALTTTMFARLVLGDLFLHGIGGAKYDELGDAVLRRFFGIEPPGYVALSLTVRLGIHESPASAERLRNARYLMRDLTFNPDRHLPDPPPAEARQAIAAKRAAIAGPVATRRDRVARYHSIRELNDAIRPALQPRIQDLEMERDALRRGLAWNAVARARDYAFVLHSRAHLRSSFAAALAGLGPASCSL